MNEYLFKRFSERIWADPNFSQFLGCFSEEEADRIVKNLVEGLLIEADEY